MKESPGLVPAAASDRVLPIVTVGQIDFSFFL